MLATVVLYYVLVVLAGISALTLVTSIVARVVSAVVESRVTWRMFYLFGRVTCFSLVNETIEKVIALSLCLGALTAFFSVGLHHKLWP